VGGGQRKKMENGRNGDGNYDFSGMFFFLQISLINIKTAIINKTHRKRKFFEREKEKKRKREKKS
jgi:hypothetical protein